MAAQELQKRQDVAAATRAELEEDLARQREFFKEREADLLTRHPGKFIAVCAGEVFVGDGATEAISKAEAAHPDRPILLDGNDNFVGCL